MQASYVNSLYQLGDFVTQYTLRYYNVVL